MFQEINTNIKNRKNETIEIINNKYKSQQELNKIESKYSKLSDIVSIEQKLNNKMPTIERKYTESGLRMEKIQNKYLHEKLDKIEKKYKDTRTFVDVHKKLHEYQDYDHLININNLSKKEIYDNEEYLAIQLLNKQKSYKEDDEKIEINKFMFKKKELNYAKIVLYIAIHLFLVKYITTYGVATITMKTFLKYLQKYSATFIGKKLICNYLNTYMKENNIPPIIYTLIYHALVIYFQKENITSKIIQQSIQILLENKDTVMKELDNILEKIENFIELNIETKGFNTIHESLSLTKDLLKHRTFENVENIALTITSSLFIAFSKGEIDKEVMQNLILQVIKNQYSNYIVEMISKNWNHEILKDQEITNHTIHKLLFGYTFFTNDELQEKNVNELKKELVNRGIEHSESVKKRMAIKMILSHQQQLNLNIILQLLTKQIIFFISNEIMNQTNQMISKEKVIEETETHIKEKSEIIKKINVELEKQNIINNKEEAVETQVKIEKEETKQKTFDVTTERLITELVESGVNESALREKLEEIDKNDEMFWPLLDEFITSTTKSIGMLYLTGYSPYYAKLLKYIQASSGVIKLSSKTTNFINTTNNLGVTNILPTTLQYVKKVDETIIQPLLYIDNKTDDLVLEMVSQKTSKTELFLKALVDLRKNNMDIQATAPSVMLNLLTSHNTQWLLNNTLINNALSKLIVNTNITDDISSVLQEFILENNL